MNMFFDALPEFLGALGAAVAMGLGALIARTLRGTRPAPMPLAGPTVDQSKLAARRFTLLETTHISGETVQITTTRPAGTVITYRSDDHAERFELTDIPLGDGTYVAEPLDRYA
ncbi:hypothetical protein [Streptomyces sp. YS415]|uniref:hypothetical protein n=1 Tax=Streptomyces sp. YS415 TaxID=2944806 RepID=UPI0020218DED|nr:hypothetical protein [Streptomyces sp. YS415]MCL7429824.1 hypothetical protein [Streptomyces sp. YS415]